MAKILKGSMLAGLRGSFDDYTIYQTKNGPVIRKKSSVSKSRFANDPCYAKVRDNNKEFGNAGRAVKLIRSAFNRQLVFAKDAKLTPRMQKLMMQVVKSDAVADHGERSAANGDLSFLKQFDCNAAAQIDRILQSPHSVEIDRARGKVKLALPSIVPTKQLAQPAGATHYRVICASSEIDFTGNNYHTSISESPLLPIGNTASDALTLCTGFTPRSVLPVFVALGIQFVELINGKEFQEDYNRYNPLCFVKIEKP